MIGLSSIILAGCGNPNAAAENVADNNVAQSASLVSNIARVFTEKKYNVPAGTEILVRLDQRLSSDKNTSGEEFKAHLDAAIESEGKVLAPAGSPVIGELIQVEESGRVRGRAEMTLHLRELRIGGENYDLSARPMTIRAQSSKERDAKVIAGSGALGAIIGAIAGGGKGAAIGAGVGAGAGTGVVLSTKGKSVEFAPETRLTFVLAEPLELPANENEG